MRDSTNRLSHAPSTHAGAVGRLSVTISWEKRAFREYLRTDVERARQAKDGIEQHIERAIVVLSGEPTDGGSWCDAARCRAIIVWEGDSVEHAEAFFWPIAEATISFQVVPAPAVASFLLAGLIATRRRR